MDKLRSKGRLGAERLAAYYAHPEKAAERRQQAIERLNSEESRRKMRAALRGCDVPPELEEEWGGLKRKGFSSREAAAALGLKVKMPRREPSRT